MKYSENLLRKSLCGLMLATMVTTPLITTNMQVHADSQVATVTRYNGDDKITVINPQNNVSSNFVLIESNGHYGLFDAGSAGSQKEYDILTQYLKDVGITTLDFIIVSHLDTDHISTISTIYGQESSTLFNDFTIKKLYIKEVEDTTTYATASSLKTTGAAMYAQNQKLFNDITSTASATGTEIETITAGSSPQFQFGEFTVNILNTQSADSREKGNYWNNLDSLVEYVTKTDSNGNVYNMLITNDLEGYDIPSVVSDLQSRGVSYIDGFMLNHHGYSQNQTEANDIEQTFGVPITVVTNTESTYANRDSTKTLYQNLNNIYGQSLYWQGNGSVQYNFSDLDTNGLTVTQENSNRLSTVKHTPNRSLTNETTAITTSYNDLVTDYGNLQYNKATNQQNTSAQNAEQQLINDSTTTTTVLDTTTELQDDKTTTQATTTEPSSSYSSDSSVNSPKSATETTNSNNSENLAKTGLTNNTALITLATLAISSALLVVLNKSKLMTKFRK